MTRRLGPSTLFLAAALAAAPLFATDTYTVDKNHSDVSFQVRHFVSKVRGGFTDFEGTIQVDSAKPDASSVVFTIKTASISTNNEGRDKHLNSPDFFDTAKYPEISFKSTKVVPTGKDKYDVTGAFTMHGVTKEITLPVTYLGTVKDPRGSERAGFELNTKLNRKDYSVNWNKSLDNGGMMLSDEVDITISLETVKKGPEAPPAK
jgi:polyisoprenoid-binding protein YceI